MAQESSVEEIFFKYLMQYQFKEEDLDYSLVNKHVEVLKALSNFGNSGVSLFDISKIQTLYYSSNFGELLGYVRSDYEEMGQMFFEQKIHPEDKLKLSKSGVSLLKLFDNFSTADKLSHKVINEYRMLNAQSKYVRLIEQHQILELDKSGKLWLLLGFVDISPDQDEYNGVKTQLLNFKTGAFIPLPEETQIQVELSKRELEILRYVKDGLLSKEISDKLSISVHTVNTHRQRFLEKLGANNSIEAVSFAVKCGLLN